MEDGRTMWSNFYKEFFKHLKIEHLGKLKKHLGGWWQWLEDKDTKGVLPEGNNV